MEGDGSDEVDVLEAAEALPAGDVPEADGLVHGGGQQEVVLRPAQVQHVGRVTLLLLIESINLNGSTHKHIYTG